MALAVKISLVRVVCPDLRGGSLHYGWNRSPQLAESLAGVGGQFNIIQASSSTIAIINDHLSTLVWNKKLALQLD